MPDRPRLPILATLHDDLARPTMNLLHRASSFTLAVALVAAALVLSLMLPVVAHATTLA